MQIQELYNLVTGEVTREIETQLREIDLHERGAPARALRLQAIQGRISMTTEAGTSDILWVIESMGHEVRQTGSHGALQWFIVLMLDCCERD